MSHPKTGVAHCQLEPIAMTAWDRSLPVPGFLR